MTSIRFYLDENVDHDVARGLRTRAIDVLTTPKAGKWASAIRSIFHLRGKKCALLSHRMKIS